MISFSESGREDSFRTEVRQRDGRCVISGDINLLEPWDIWDGLQAAHVFPLEKENLWTQYNFGRWITNMDHTTGVSKINSVQNGLLMGATLHGCFYQYMFSINPDVRFLMTKSLRRIRDRTDIRLSHLHQIPTESMEKSLTRSAGIQTT